MFLVLEATSGMLTRRSNLQQCWQGRRQPIQCRSGDGKAFSNGDRNRLLASDILQRERERAWKSLASKPAIIGPAHFSKNYLSLLPFNALCFLLLLLLPYSTWASGIARSWRNLWRRHNSLVLGILYPATYRELNQFVLQDSRLGGIGVSTARIARKYLKPSEQRNTLHTI